MAASQAITCPWCGTSYLDFRSNCANCGGPLPAPAWTAPVEGVSASAERSGPPPPPPAPRPVPQSYLGRLLLADPTMMIMGVVALVGTIFMFTGFVLTVVIITAFVGIPFLLLGFVMAAVAGGLMAWRYSEGQKVMELVRTGEAACGEVTSVAEDYFVRVNHRHPWTVEYRFDLGGQAYHGKVTTLAWPGPEQQPGRKVWVIYDREKVERNTLYPVI